jgi:hypothetical protein
MGYTTDFIGHIDIEPSLNEAEIAYLMAFSSSRRCLREDGPYAVPGNPAAEDQAAMPTWQANQVAEGQPGYRCDWEPCWDGCCLALNGNEKFYSPVAWLRYLIKHFLKPGALAAKSGLGCFDAFTFDHVLKGIVVGCRRDNKELYAINVRDNRVTEKILRPADPRYLDYPPLPYEAAIDRWEGRSARRRKRKAQRQDAEVIQLPTDRALGQP